jgi:beta-glucosidase
MALTEFPKDFVWGAATAAYQIEGAVREDGRGESIWDRFSHTPGMTANGDTGDVACDHYHLWRKDLDNMKAIGLMGYRFSIAWPRVFPSGRGGLNRKGLDFYSNLVDALLEKGIQPAATLYHWDLPQELQDKGGWTSRDTARYFADYAAAVFSRLGDRVGTWITLNEPQVSAFVGYAHGRHAPGLADYHLAVQASHELMMAHAFAVEVYRELCPGKGAIGITLNLHSVYPLTDSMEDEAATRLADGVANRWYLDPVFKGGYPQDVLDLYTSKGVVQAFHEDDLAQLGKNKPDFIGVNFYFPQRVRRIDPHHPILGFETVIPPDCPKTEMGWEVYPEGLHDLLVRLDRDYGSPVLSITENGAAYADKKVERGQVQDDDRISYIASHLRECLRAVNGGVKLASYYVWSLMDNFEWAYGYAMRFGLTHVDYRTQARTWKKSAGWYRDLIASNGASLW